MCVQNSEPVQEKFSFLVVSRSELQNSEVVQWSKIISPVHRRPRHVQCQICCSNGELKQLAITARHHGRYGAECALHPRVLITVHPYKSHRVWDRTYGHARTHAHTDRQTDRACWCLSLISSINNLCVYRDTYRCARSSDWGDRLPIIHTEKHAHE